MDDDGVVRSVEDAWEWLSMAMERLDDEWHCVKEHIECIEPGDESRMSPVDWETNCQEFYALLKHLPAMSQHLITTCDIVARWIAPQVIVERIAIENIEVMTGTPLRIVESIKGVGLVIAPDDEIPDDLRGLDEQPG